MGPAWLTAAIYLNVIGSKLAGGRAVRKGAGGGVSLGISQRPVHTQPQPWRGVGVSREAVLSMVLNHAGPFFFLGTVWAEVGECLELRAALESDGSWGPLQWRNTGRNRK